MPDLAATAGSPETRLAQTQSDTDEQLGGSERQCGRCSAENNFLVYLEFGQGLSADARLCIERSVRRALRSKDACADGDYYRTPRKRRRYESSSSSIGAGGRRSGRYMDYYSNNHSGDDNDDAAGNKRKRESEKGAGGATCTNSTLVMYGEDAGFDLDTTRDNDSDTDLIEYKRGTRSIVGLAVDPMQGQGNACFNCSMPGHEIRDCPMPIDKRQVDANRKAFKDKELGQFNSRLYIVVEEEKHAEEMRKKYRPGLPLSSELCDALDLKSVDDTPEYVDSMYYYGYPPAYLGSDPDQDPMSARGKPGPKAPPTTVPLRVYNDAKDYEPECDYSASGEDDEPEKTAGDNEDSDEEGAIDEGDSIKENDANGDSLPLSRNIPLVKYPGLDLNEFDFTSDNPGQPLRQRNVYRYAQQPDRNDRSQRTLYDPPYRHDGHYGNGYGGGRNFTRQRNNMYSDYHSQYQDDPVEPTYSTPSQRGFEWDTMLTGYYSAAQSRHPVNNGGALRSQEYEYPPSPANPPPRLPPASSQQPSTLQDGNSPLSQAGEKDDGEIEDGECDME
ncbi:hypothetical protein LPJ81_004865, partial [Coemansia sp. IMI 209127]